MTMVKIKLSQKQDDILTKVCILEGINYHTTESSSIYNTAEISDAGFIKLTLIGCEFLEIQPLPGSAVSTEFKTKSLKLLSEFYD